MMGLQILFVLQEVGIVMKAARQLMAMFPAVHAVVSVMIGCQMD
jgi:hypothetical protein